MRLRGLREDLDMTVEEVASKCGITPDELKCYESGESDIPMNFLCNAASVLGVEPLELFLVPLVQKLINLRRLLARKQSLQQPQ